MTVNRSALGFLALAATLVVIGVWMLLPAAGVITAGFLSAVAGVMSLEVKPNAGMGAPGKPRQ